MRSTEPYGCHNRDQFDLGHFGQERTYDANGRWQTQLVYIANKMSRECRYDNKSTDARCYGCRHGELNEST